MPLLAGWCLMYDIVTWLDGANKHLWIKHKSIPQSNSLVDYFGFEYVGKKCDNVRILIKLSNKGLVIFSHFNSEFWDIIPPVHLVLNYQTTGGGGRQRHFIPPHHQHRSSLLYSMFTHPCVATSDSNQQGPVKNLSVCITGDFLYLNHRKHPDRQLRGS